MADEPDPNEEEVLELTETADEDGEPEAAEAEDDADEEGEESPGEEAGEEETVVAFDDDTEEQPSDSDLIRHLRQQLKETSAKLSEARKAIPETPAIEVGEEPDLASCDYDEEAFKAEWKAWNERRQQAEQAKAKADEEVKAANEEWQRDLAAYGEKKQALALPDYEEIEAHVVSSLNRSQQAALVQAAAEPALFVAALGRNQAKLDELAKIKNPIKLAAAIARMEGAIKVQKRRKGPAIDTPQKGGAPVAGAADKKLAELEKEARSTGDYSKVMAHKREMRERAR